MDVSLEYIKMCEKAEEIEKEHPFRSGDFWTSSKSSFIFSFAPGELTGDFLTPEMWDVGKHERGFTFNSRMVWLPRQDQLQEMVNDFPEHPKGIINKLYQFADFVHKEPYLPKSFKDIEKGEACHFFTSMEQLWLAFVMKIRYDKVWDSEDWVLTNR